MTEANEKRFFGPTVSIGSRGLAAFMLLIAALQFAPTSSAAGSAFITSVAVSPPPTGARQLCREYAWACARKSSQQLDGRAEMQAVQLVNRRVNASTREVADQSQYKTAERWALPTARGGDCEDFALLKKRDLIQAGVDPKKLLIATVLDRRRNSHAVLIYRSTRGDLVLDNLTNRIKPWAATRYLFLRMQDPRQPERWVGVYSRS